MHRLVLDDAAAERLRQRLVAEADAERRDAGLGEAAHRLDRDARPRRACTGPGETTTRSGRRSSSSSTVGGVVAHDVELGAQLAQVLDEVVGERVVVVDDEDAHPSWPLRLLAPQLEAPQDGAALASRLRDS